MFKVRYWIAVLVVAVIGIFSYWPAAVPKARVEKISLSDGGSGWNITIVSDVDFKSETGSFINVSMKCPLFDNSERRYDPGYYAKIRMTGGDNEELNLIAEETPGNSQYHSIFTLMPEKSSAGSEGNADLMQRADLAGLLNKSDIVKCKIVATRYLRDPVYSEEISIPADELLSAQPEDTAYPGGQF